MEDIIMIEELGARCFQLMNEALSGTPFPEARLSRLNKCLDDFYEFLYSRFNSVTAGDYEVFGPQLSVLVSTLKDLYRTCVALPKSWDLTKETERLGMNYSALHEIESDLRQFKAVEKQDPELLRLLAAAGERMKRLVNREDFANREDFKGRI